MVRKCKFLPVCDQFSSVTPPTVSYKRNHRLDRGNKSEQKQHDSHLHIVNDELHVSREVEVGHLEDEGVAEERHSTRAVNLQVSQSDDHCTAPKTRRYFSAKLFHHRCLSNPWSDPFHDGSSPRLPYENKATTECETYFCSPKASDRTRWSPTETKLLVHSQPAVALRQLTRRPDLQVRHISLSNVQHSAAFLKVFLSAPSDVK